MTHGLQPTLFDYLDEVLKHLVEHHTPPGATDAAVEAARDKRDELSTFMQLLLQQTLSAIFGVRESNHRAALSIIVQREHEITDPETKTVVRHFRTITYSWTDFFGQAYVRKPVAFRRLLTNVLPEMLLALHAYVGHLGDAPLAARLEELNILWSNRFPKEA